MFEFLSGIFVGASTAVTGLAVTFLALPIWMEVISVLCLGLFFNQVYVGFGEQVTNFRRAISMAVSTAALIALAWIFGAPISVQTALIMLGVFFIGVILAIPTGWFSYLKKVAVTYVSLQKYREQSSRKYEYLRGRMSKVIFQFPNQDGTVQEIPAIQALNDCLSMIEACDSHLNDDEHEALRDFVRNVVKTMEFGTEVVDSNLYDSRYRASCGLSDNNAQRLETLFKAATCDEIVISEKLIEDLQTKREYGRYSLGLDTMVEVNRDAGETFKVSRNWLKSQEDVNKALFCVLSDLWYVAFELRKMSTPDVRKFKVYLISYALAWPFNVLDYLLFKFINRLISRVFDAIATVLRKSTKRIFARMLESAKNQSE